MEKILYARFSAKNEMIKSGQIVKAMEMYFARNAKTKNFDGTVTKTKAEIVKKMQGFAATIATVNVITLLYSAISGNISFAEFNVDFDMKDGSRVLWHEIIRSVWEKGEIIEEQHFKG